MRPRVHYIPTGMYAMKTETVSDTKEKLLDAAQGLMLEKGFVATSIDEICEAAGLTKGSFFHYFENKEELGKVLVRRFSETMGAHFNEAACSCGSADPLDRIYACIDAAIEMSKDPKSKGCLVGTLTQELYESHPNIRSVCCESFAAGVRFFKKTLAEAKTKYAPRSPVDPEALAEMYLATVQGSMILMKATKDRSVMERTLQNYKAYVKSIFEK